MIIIQRTLLFVTCLSLLACAGPGRSPEDIQQTQASQAEALHTDAKQAIENGNYMTAIENLELIQARYPFGETARSALLDLALAYQKDGQREEAITTANRFIQENPRHPRSDFAYYLRGLSFYQQEPGRLRQRLGVRQAMRPSHFDQRAYQFFKQFVAAYPDSEYVADANSKIDELYERIALHEWYIADYYLERGAYVAAVRRLTTLLETYPDSEATSMALNTLESSYRALMLNELAEAVAQHQAISTP